MWSHPEQTKTESNVSVFWWPEESDDVTSHAVLSSTSPSVVTLTGFTLSTTMLNWQKESQWGVKVAPREVYFCIVSYLRQIRSLRKFKASRFLLTELKSSPNLWWSWGPHLWQVLGYWLYTREQFSHIRNSISDEASGCSWMQRRFLMFNTLLQPIRSLSRLHKPELKKLRTTNHNHTYFFQGFWKITQPCNINQVRTIIGWMDFVFSAVT